MVAGVLVLPLILLLLADPAFDVQGQLSPGMQAAVSLHAASSPFITSTIADAGGRFRFKGIPAGSYTITIFIPGRGETHKTIDIGPSLADRKGRVAVAVEVDEAKLDAEGRHIVSARELSVPEKARQEYARAEKQLARNDVEGAVSRLEKATEMAPQFTMAWNHLGTIAYQTRRYSDAERYFRRALEADPEAYAPLVNLGGVLLNLGQFDEAWKYNLYAVLKRPNEALANSQLGMTYLNLGKPDLAEKHLREAVRIDPGHFSHPQLYLSEISVRRKDFNEAADWIEDFLKYHPDWPEAARMRESAARWRNAPAKN